MQTLSEKRLGCFTASGVYQLIPGPRGGTATRSKYIFEKAEERVKGYAKNFSTFDTRHGQYNEHEAIEEFEKLTGWNIVPGNQEYLPIDENSGATPDAYRKDFDDIIIATCDMKCPTETFFTQKMQIINDSKPEYQNSPLSMFVQAQMQMRAATIYNANLGHPPVTTHYLVRYLTSAIVDEDGNKKEIDLPIEARIFWKEITFDEVFYNTFITPNIDTAAQERDLLIKIFKQPIYDGNIR